MWRKIAAVLAGVFCLLGCACNAQNTDEYTVYAPDGAPALALAKAFAEDGDADGVSYFVTAGSAIGAYIAYEDEEKNADACILPLNLAAKKLGDGARYQLAGVVTHGNLYLMSAENTPVESPAALLGKTVRIAQLANVPGLVMKLVLENNGLAYQSLAENAAAVDKVNLTTSGEADFWVADSLQAAGENAYAVGDLQAWYGGENGYPQAVLVVKKSLINDRRTARLISAIAGAADYLATASIAKVCADVQARMAQGAQTKITVNTLNADTIEKSAIRFERASACKAEVNAFLERARQIAPDLVGEVFDEFYFMG